MKIIMALVWSVLIGAVLGYVLTSMAGDPFNMTQSLAYAAGVFIFVLLMDAVLGTATEEQ